MAYKPSRTQHGNCDIPNPQIKTEYPNKKYCCDKDITEYIDTHNYDQNPLGNREQPYYDNNASHGGNVISTDKANHMIEAPITKEKHPIVNLCESYIESIFFQYDSFPLSNNEMIWHNDKVGRIINFTYYLDSSMGDSVTVYLEKISPSGHVENLLNTPQNGNNYIKGTFNSTVLNFKLNMKIKNDDMIKVRFENASSSDCTIMANMDIKYDEEDFETSR